MEENRIVDPRMSEIDEEIEFSLRPRTLDEYIGQDAVKDNLKVFISAAKKRGEPLDHLLIYGPPGLGKTTLAMIVANEMGVNIKVTSGPAIQKAGDMAALLTNLQSGDVLFIDEIHRLSRVIEEALYSAMEDNVFDFIVGNGPSAQSIRLNLAPFTLVGATTRAGQISSPLRDRFGMIMRLEMYTNEQLSSIIKRSARLLNIDCDGEGAMNLACRSRSTPRVANRLLKRARDFAQVMGEGCVTKEIVDLTLNRLDIDELGLEVLDRRMLDTMIKNYGGGPVGLETLAATLGEEAVTIEDVYEPYLMQLGFIQRSTRGRMVTSLGYKHLGIEQTGQISI
ncbi:MAG: Holliday junction branch migration DNA helicase RuvB [Oscillospiraceae bacterium]|nr:Holliday junction branch migration DNA helicase RuvB [Oscillospiraceae bacterium]